MRFARGVANDGFALRESRRAHRVFRSGYGSFVEQDVRAAQLFALELEAVREGFDGRAQRLQRFISTDLINAATSVALYYKPTSKCLLLSLCC